MPAILPGYEYDIFISYRQNDNKRDGWVTNFVAALKDELEATLKNPVSIYFDENPHDGLLESHQVGASLENKLKCIVFIPIISQTYCDTSSFAWEHEFLPFIKMAREDELGMNITLPNGNVASRVLPVQIHDLDSEDQSALEKELGSPMRSIKFIHQAAGVNRPLTAQDDQVRESGKILYHDQINKLANALKELGTSAVRQDNNGGEEIPEKVSVVERSELSKERKSKISLKMILGLSFIPLVLILAYYLFANYNTAKPATEALEKSIAVLPFVDMSPGKDQEWFSDGLTEELLNTLARMPDIKLMARTSSFAFKGKKLTAQSIADSLKVNYILEGSVRKMADELRITAQLIQASDGSNLWSNTYDRTMSDIFSIQEDISENIAAALDIVLDENERERMYSIGTRNVEAYEEYLKGNELYQYAHAFSTTDSSLLKANEHYTTAILLDPTFPQPYSKRHDFYAHYFIEGDIGVYKYALADISDNQAYKIIVDDLEAAIKLNEEEDFNLVFQIDKLFLSNNWSSIPAIVEKTKVAERNNQALLLLGTGWDIPIRCIYDPESLKDHQLSKFLLDPYDPAANIYATIAYIKLHQLDSAILFLDKSNLDIQNTPALAHQRSIIEIIKGNYQQAHEILENSFLNQEVKIEDYSEYYMLTKLLSGNRNDLPELVSYINDLGLRGLPFYHLMGKYDKADSLAKVYDDKFLGPSILLRYISRNPLFFHLSATPNFSARLQELGIDPEQYEEEQYIKLPVTPIEGI